MITNDDLAYALNAIKAKQGDCRRYLSYFMGDHDLSFATDSFRNAFGYLFKELSYNRCQAVVEAFDSRLNVTGWETEGDQQSENDPLEKAATEIWRRNNMDERQSDIHGEALRSGSSYLIVWPDEDTGLATFYPNVNHLMTTVCANDGHDTVEFAVKCWKEERGEYAGRWRVTVYERDVITRFITRGKRQDLPEKLNQLIAYEDDDQPEAENPYGIVPVFHFRNSSIKGDDVGSELRDVVPLQDALNKQIADAMIAAEYLGYPQRVIAGTEPKINPVTGKTESPFETGKDRMIVLADAASKWGEFAAAQLDQFTNAQDNFDAKISRVSQVPVHWLNQTGDFPSGESLKTAEGPFVSKSRKKTIRFGGKHSDAMQFALTVDAVPGDQARFNAIAPVWAPVESRSEQEAVAVASMKKALGVPEEQVWAELGYKPEEIVQFKAAAEKKRKEQMEQFSSAFDRGNVPIGGDR